MQTAIDVLAVFEYPSLNGGERSLLACYDVLAEQGVQLQAVVPAEGPTADALRQRHVRCWPMDYHDAAGARRPATELRQDLLAILAQADVDLVHANSLSTARLLGPIMQQAALPSVGHIRDIMRISAAAVADVNCHTRLLAVSQATRDFYCKLGLDATKLFVATNGVDLDCFSPRPRTGHLHRELGIDLQCPLIGTIGQISLRKGCDLFLKAAATVARSDASAHFVMIGKRHSDKQETCELEQQLHQESDRPPLAGRVHFLGVREDVPNVLPELTMLVHAARQEPLGRVLLEAAACGLPIVATDVGGTREIFGDVTTAATIIPPDRPAAMARAMRSLLDDSQLRASLGQAARQRIVHSFGDRQAAAELASHYRAVLSE